MKKKILVILFICLSATACKNKDSEIIDYSKYKFTDISWERPSDNDNDKTYIEFYSNGMFGYYCSCGNPIENYDLCSEYTYDDATKTITLKCEKNSKNIEKTIKIKSQTSKKLVLSFGKETRTFTKGTPLNQT